MNKPSRPDTTRRRGFTLVELLVVILILAILIALLVPAIASAVRAANDARVAAEINNLATSLADFKNKYGDYPPSRIVLPTTNTVNGLAQLIAGGTSRIYQPNNEPDISLRDLASRTQRYLLKFFPRATSVNAFSLPPVGNESFVILQGHECLVFFLGGIPQYDATTNTYTMKGFSKDPTAPLSMVGTNRTQPFYEFPSARLQDIYSAQIGSNGAQFNHFPSFMDPLGSNNQDYRPYAYFSAYGNNNYDPNDDNFMAIGIYESPASTTPVPDSVEYDDSQTGTPIFRAFQVNFPVLGNSNSNSQELSFGPNPYTSSDPTINAVNYINPQTFQIISAGRDRQFGLGGAYTPNSTSNKLPISAAEATAFPAFTSLRFRERDNITNFAAGKLD